jgi:hypothetical protein
MARIIGAWIIGLFLLAGGAHGADGAAGVGTWRVSILEGTEKLTYWLVQLEMKDGKWSGKVLATADEVPPSTLEELSANADRLRFTIKMKGQTQGFTLEVKLPKEAAKTLYASISRGRLITTAVLEATTLKTLDNYELAKEVLAATTPNDPRLFGTALGLLRQAGEHKAKPEEVRGWADKAFKAAEVYGPRWQREIAISTAEALMNQDGFTAIALEHARRAERMLDAKDDAASQIRALNALAVVLKKADKAEEAKEALARIDKLEAAADAEYLKTNPPFKPGTFEGRKAKSERVALVELFTGAQCPPCVAADLAFDALTRTYKPSDVVLLQYHLHIPKPDALANPDSEDRARYYGDEIEGTPTMIVNGKPRPGGGGGADDSAGKYTEYRGAIDESLEKPAKATLKASATQKGNKIEVAAEVAGLDKAGDQVRLRFALIEEEVRYVGTNGVRLHHHVVRALPGGPNGFAVKSGKQTASVDTDELRKTWMKYLDSVAKKAPFPSEARPLDLKKLSLVAFLQDDRTKEVLQATQVVVGGDGGEK